MSEKLTVAELLARSGRTASSGGRRRRRSLDEGGISVAELTGSIPVVEAADIEKAEAERAAAAENDAAEADAAADGTEIVDRTEASEVRPEEQTSEMQAVEEPASPLGSVDDAPRDEAPAEEALAEGAPVEEDAVAGSEAEAPVEHAEPARTSPAIDETTVLTKVTAEHLQPEGVEPEELYSPAPHQGRTSRSWNAASARTRSSSTRMTRFPGPP